MPESVPRGRLVVLCLALCLILALPAAQAAGIYRAFFSFTLGMPLDIFLSTTPAEEISHRENERVFGVRGDGADVQGVTVTFTDERLSRIEAVYSTEFSARMSWTSFVETATRKYGTGFHLPTPGGEVEMWDDGYTTLTLERRSAHRGTTYVLTLADDAVALERPSRCEPRLEV